ncbi:hypothetical protein CANCADRAFT_93716 [Tortispora caseinolytica NRRL Y-17796]|uniref:Cwf19-like C-terminal domain-containing protein n=1 Tax=Tortispora caseinolytica NRRL Y-17796 TaxID=767744 RepID=A0A1E4TM70_9ASCO|nr:hypothetical protein CANCADRAFT_93716 [Tortispora caseinolytica NRRL Y-17796]
MAKRRDEWMSLGDENSISLSVDGRQIKRQKKEQEIAERRGKEQHLLNERTIKLSNDPEPEIDGSRWTKKKLQKVQDLIKSENIPLEKAVLQYFDSMDQYRRAARSESDMSVQELAAIERATTGFFKSQPKAVARDNLSASDEIKHMDRTPPLKSATTKPSVTKQVCPLCFHDTDLGLAPVVALGLRTYLTLPTEPELAQYSAMIVPLEHHTSMLQCEQDEWDEVRNFMKSLARMYYSLGKGVIFYENALGGPKGHQHAAISAVPTPLNITANEWKAIFSRSYEITETEEWTQHKKVIDTTKTAENKGFRHSMVPDLPYFHLWTSIDGGIGHVIENKRSWPRGDLFARQNIGSVLKLPIDVINKQGKWPSPRQAERLDQFKENWHKYDWTVDLG